LSWVAVCKLPEVPPIVTIAVPDGTFGPAVIVIVLAVVAGFGLKVAVTPVGKLLAASVTAPPRIRPEDKS